MRYNRQYSRWHNMRHSKRSGSGWPARPHGRRGGAEERAGWRGCGALPGCACRSALAHLPAPRARQCADERAIAKGVGLQGQRAGAGSRAWEGDQRAACGGTPGAGVPRPGSCAGCRAEWVQAVCSACRGSAGGTLRRVCTKARERCPRSAAAESAAAAHLDVYRGHGFEYFNGLARLLGLGGLHGWQVGRGDAGRSARLPGWRAPQRQRAAYRHRKPPAAAWATVEGRPGPLAACPGGTRPPPRQLRCMATAAARPAAGAARERPPIAAALGCHGCRGAGERGGGSSPSVSRK